MTDTKICGLKDRHALLAALDAGAGYVGLNFYPKTPRFVPPAEAAPLAALAKGRAKRVGLVVDASDDEIADILAAVPLDILQLHGKETPARTAAIRDRFGRPVIKALSVSTAAEIAAADAYDAADILLFDAKPPKRSDALPGGNAVSFDWTILADPPAKPWMLSGGLTAETVASAIRTARPPAVDVSSGVERERGVKDASLIQAFLNAVKAADQMDA